MKTNAIFRLKPIAALIGGAAAMLATSVGAELPATEHQANVATGVEQANTQWSDRIRNLPATRHQREVLDDFTKADADGDSKLSPDEYAEFTTIRADRIFDYSYYAQTPVTSKFFYNPTNRNNLTAAAMVGLDDKFAKADRTGDGALGILEVYYYETFDRPGLFPTASESVPQETSGHWETVTVGEEARVLHKIPFSPETHRQPIEQGGFTAVDDNDDGVVSLIEANDFSMLTWTGAVRAFVTSDVDGNAVLTKAEFENFTSELAQSKQQAESTRCAAVGARRRSVITRTRPAIVAGRRGRRVPRVIRYG